VSESRKVRSKPPAFQFYAGDFLQGTAEMTLEETGLYIRLLCHQWIAGSIPSEPSRASALAHTTAEAFERLWPVVAPKFRAGPDGRLRNARLEAAREAQRQWREGQRAAGKAGAEKRWRGHGEPISDADGDPNGDPNGKNMPLHSSLFSPRSSSSPSGLRPSETGEPKTQALLVPPEAAELAERLRDRILKNNPNAKITKHQLAAWGTVARLMIERDRRDPREIAGIIEWCQHDSFWLTNILSMGKLREKYDELTLKMQRPNGGANGRSYRQQQEDAGLRQAAEFVRGEEPSRQGGGTYGSLPPGKADSIRTARLLGLSAKPRS
jgi:uncharacterized protein YdaU (DUF1376 family)